MTDIEWGPAIEVNGVRPDWLVGSTPGLTSGKIEYDGRWCEQVGRYNCWAWHGITALRLPATHPYYLATSRGFTYWPGGENAPEDWDGGEVLDVHGNVQKSSWIGRWSRKGEGYYDIIGYRKRTEQPVPAIAPELVERMVALVRSMSEGQNISHGREARAILAELTPPDPDLTLAKSIMGDAEAIALAIKAARESGRG